MITMEEEQNNRLRDDTIGNTETSVQSEKNSVCSETISTSQKPRNDFTVSIKVEVDTESSAQFNSSLNKVYNSQMKSKYIHETDLPNLPIPKLKPPVTVEDYNCKLCKRLLTRVKEKRKMMCFNCKPINTKRRSPIATNYQCTICNKYLRSNANLERHMVVHNRRNKFQCHICKKEVKMFSTLKSHIDQHLGQTKYKCPVCGHNFTRRSNLRLHIVSHTKVKNFECTLCDIKYIHKSNLRRHMLTHSGIKEHQCTECNKKFSQLGYLKEHLLTHIGRNGLRCPVCNSGFTHRSNYKRHMESHSGVKKYQCTVCDKRYTQSTTLNLHFIRKHGAQ